MTKQRILARRNITLVMPPYMREESYAIARDCNPLSRLFDTKHVNMKDIHKLWRLDSSLYQLDGRKTFDAPFFVDLVHHIVNIITTSDYLDWSAVSRFDHSDHKFFHTGEI
jgi:hypothetical protein